MIEFIDTEETRERSSSPARIKVLGVGGAGGNTVNSIVESGCQDIDFVVANTDVQALSLSLAEQRLRRFLQCHRRVGGS